MKGKSKRTIRIRGLSMPNAGGLWKDKVSGVVLVVVGRGRGYILVRERDSLDGEPVKIMDIVRFYEDYSYIGKQEV